MKKCLLCLLAVVLLLSACNMPEVEIQTTNPELPMWGTGYRVRSRPYCEHSWMPETMVRYCLAEDGYLLGAYRDPLLIGKLEQVRMSKKAFLSMCPPPDTFWHEHYTAEEIWSQTDKVWYTESENSGACYYLLQLQDGKMALAWLKQRTSKIGGIEILEPVKMQNETIDEWSAWQNKKQSDSTPEWIAFCERFRT